MWFLPEKERFICVVSSGKGKVHPCGFFRKRKVSSLWFYSGEGKVHLCGFFRRRKGSSLWFLPEKERFICVVSSGEGKVHLCGFFRKRKGSSVWFLPEKKDSSLWFLPEKERLVPIVSSEKTVNYKVLFLFLNFLHLFHTLVRVNWMYCKVNFQVCNFIFPGLWLFLIFSTAAAIPLIMLLPLLKLLLLKLLLLLLLLLLLKLLLLLLLLLLLQYFYCN